MKIDVDAPAARGANPTGEIVKTSLFEKIASTFDPNVGRLSVDSRDVEEPVCPIV